MNHGEHSVRHRMKIYVYYILRASGPWLDSVPSKFQWGVPYRSLGGYSIRLQDKVHVYQIVILSQVCFESVFQV